MNLMDLRARDWWTPALQATAPGLAAKLPPIVAPWSRVGTLAPYWQQRYGLPAARGHRVVWRQPVQPGGHRPRARRTTRRSRSARATRSSAPMASRDVDASGTGHVFGAPTGEFMGLTCFQQRIARARAGARITRRVVAGVLPPARGAPPGNGGRVMLPWFVSEITPALPLRACAATVRCRAPPSDVRGGDRSQMMSMALHSQWMARRVDTIHATGGAAVNREILQVMADVFGADVYQLRRRQFGGARRGAARGPRAPAGSRSDDALDRRRGGTGRTGDGLADRATAGSACLLPRDAGDLCRVRSARARTRSRSGSAARPRSDADGVGQRRAVTRHAVTPRRRDAPGCRTRPAV